MNVPMLRETLDTIVDFFVYQSDRTGRHGVEQMRQALGLTHEQIDALFLGAANG